MTQPDKPTVSAETMSIEYIKKAILRRKGLTMLTNEDCDVLEAIIIRYASQQVAERDKEIEQLQEYNKNIVDFCDFCKSIAEEQMKYINKIMKPCPTKS